MRYVVGYTANARGRDALNLAVSLARGRGAALDLVMAIPDAGVFNAAHPPAAGYDSYLHRQASEWLDEALALVPADVPAKAHIRSGDSDAQTLIDACDEFQADMLIIGATSNGLFKRFTVGSVAGALLHAATVPVALAPHGYHRREALTRLSCGLGDRPGAEELLEVAVSMATHRDVPLRVVSLLTLDGGDSAAAADAARDYAAQRVAAALPGDPSGDPAAAQLADKIEVVVAHGRQHRGGGGPAGLGRRRGPADRIEPARPEQLHLPGQHGKPHPAGPAGADDRGPQRLRAQTAQPFNVE